MIFTFKSDLIQARLNMSDIMLKLKSKLDQSVNNVTGMYANSNIIAFLNF